MIQDISKDPNTNKERIVETQVLFLNNGTEDEIRLLCMVWQTTNAGVKIVGTNKLFTPTTIGEYVDSTGKKKDKNDLGAIPKKDYYYSKKRGGTKSDLDNILDTFKEEIDELDKIGYFNT